MTDVERPVQTEFYEERGLPEPRAELVPDGTRELRRVVADSSAERPILVVGGGEHLRAGAVGRRPFDVLRTEECDRIRAVDAESGTVRVEAGISWARLRSELRDRGESLQRYQLQPESATIGGLLARWRPHEKEVHTGDLREGCIALTTAGPGGADYDYMPAPRKSSGPDNRFLYIGGEGFAGAILEATLVVWPTLPGRLLSKEVDGIGAAVRAYRRITASDLRCSWAHWSSRGGRLEVAFHGPQPILDAYERRVRDLLGAGVGWAEGRAVRARREELERAHPGGRSAPRAERTCRVVWNLGEIEESVARISEALEAAEICRWGTRRAAVHLVFRGEIEEALEGETFPRALSHRRIIDDGEATWPERSRRLKQQLDPEGRLAVGP